MDNIKRIVVVHSPKSTRSKLFTLIKKTVENLADKKQINIVYIPVVDKPYFEAATMVKHRLRDDDLVLAAGGDGISQMTFQAVYDSKKDIIYGTIPLGNSNDIARAFNKKFRTASAILEQSVVDFYPLKVVTDNKIKLALISYVTFGATTVLVDYLNAPNGRKLRKVLKALTPAAAVPVTKLGEISRKISNLKPLNITRGDQTISDNSLGLFLINAAHNVLRVPKDMRFLKADFYFHHADMANTNFLKKAVLAIRWTAHFPGRTTVLEEWKIKKPNKHTIANISGDNVDLGYVTTLAACRSTRAVKILATKN